jgi:hypothetical protein
VFQEAREQRLVHFPAHGRGAVGIVGLAQQDTRSVIEHDIARPCVERHHAATVRVGQLAVRDAADVEGENRPDLAEDYEIEELHQRRARAAERMLDRVEPRHDGRVAGRGHDRRFCDLQPARIGAAEPGPTRSSSEAKVAIRCGSAGSR